MKIYNQNEFNSLEVEDQVTLTSLIGTHLMTRKDGNYRVKLYQLYNFYVEVWIDGYEAKLLYARTFKSTRGLSPYLSSIDLDFLLYK